MENQPKFKICLTMAGAVSAGAFTAGVLDYLLETLDVWEKAKQKNREIGVGNEGIILDLVPADNFYRRL